MIGSRTQSRWPPLTRRYRVPRTNGVSDTGRRRVVINEIRLNRHAGAFERSFSRRDSRYVQYYTSSRCTLCTFYTHTHVYFLCVCVRIIIYRILLQFNGVPPVDITVGRTHTKYTLVYIPPDGRHFGLLTRLRSRLRARLLLRRQKLYLRCTIYMYYCT